MEKWAITRIETNELVEIFHGTFMEAMTYMDKYYEDGIFDLESYENWLGRY